MEPGLEPVLREAMAALGRAGAEEGPAAALGAVLGALAAAGGSAALGERERALLGAFLRCLARAPGAARPQGVWQRCFLEGPPGLGLCILLEALGSAGSVRLPGAGGRGQQGCLGVPFSWAGVRRGREMWVSAGNACAALSAFRPHTMLSQSTFSRDC